MTRIFVKLPAIQALYRPITFIPTYRHIQPIVFDLVVYLRSRSAESVAETPMEGSRPAQPAEPGTLNPTLAETPGNLIYLIFISVLFTLSD